MKKFFFFAVAALMSVAMSAQTIEVFQLDSAFGVSKGLVKGKSDAGPLVAAGEFYAGTNFSVSLPYETKMAIVGAAQPNGAHKNITIGANTLNVEYGIQGNDNPKDLNGGNPCATFLEPVSGAFWDIEAKADGYIVVLHKATSNKQYFVFENSYPLGYQFGMMTYAEETLGNNGLLNYELVGDAELNHLTADILQQSTGFNYIAKVEDYFKAAGDTTIGKDTYKQGGVSAIVFNAYNKCHYFVGGAGTKIQASAIIFVKDLTADLPIIAKGETVSEEGKDPVTYADVTIATIAAPTALNNVNESVKAQKVISNGQVLIIKEGVAYTVLGTVAK